MYICFESGSTEGNGARYSSPWPSLDADFFSQFNWRSARNIMEISDMASLLHNFQFLQRDTSVMGLEEISYDQYRL